MPELSGIAQPNGLTVLDDVGDDEDLRMIGQQKLLEHVNLQRAETAAEGDLLLGRDALVTEHQQSVIEMGTMDTSEIDVVQRLGQVQTDDFRPQRGIERANLEGLHRGDGKRGNCRHRTNSMQRRQSAHHLGRLRKQPTIKCGAPIGRQVRNETNDSTM